MRIVRWEKKESLLFKNHQASGTSSDNKWQRLEQRVETNDTEWQRMTKSGAINDNEWQQVVHRVTTNDKECQWVTTSDSECQRVVQQMKTKEIMWKSLILGFKMKEKTTLVSEEFCLVFYAIYNYCIFNSTDNL